GKENIAFLWRDLRRELIPLRGDTEQCRDLIAKTAGSKGLLRRYVRIHHWPSLGAEDLQQTLDIGHCIPCNIAARGLKFLDGFPERHGPGAGGAILHIDDDQSRMLAKARRTAEACSIIGLEIFLGDDSFPGTFHHFFPLQSVAVLVLGFEAVPAVLVDRALTLLKARE